MARPCALFTCLAQQTWRKLEPRCRHGWKPLSEERCHWGEWQIHSSILSQLTGIHPSQIKAFRSSIVCYIISFFRPHRRTVTNNSWFVLFYYVMLWTTWIRALLQMGNIYIKTIIFVQLASVAQPFQIWATMYLTLFCFLILVFFPLSISLFHFFNKKTDVQYVKGSCSLFAIWAQALVWCSI